MKTFSASQAFSEGNPLVTGGFPREGYCQGYLAYSWSVAEQIVAHTFKSPVIWRHRAHYDVIVMK